MGNTPEAPIFIETPRTVNFKLPQEVGPNDLVIISMPNRRKAEAFETVLLSRGYRAVACPVPWPIADECPGMKPDRSCVFALGAKAVIGDPNLPCRTNMVP